MKLIPLIAVLVATAHAQTADPEALWKAVREGDAKSVRMLAPGVDVNKPGADGTTLLMAAAAQGSFECARELIWAGANPDATANGKTIRDFLVPMSKTFVPIDLLVRCYAVTSAQGNRQAKAGVRNRVLINDAYVDHANPRIKEHYYVNVRELQGKPDADDDGNGFIDDIYGWNVADDAPIRIPEIMTDSSPGSRSWLERLLADYDQVDIESAGFEAIRDRLQNRHENPLVRKIGIDLAYQAGLAINDFNYARLLSDASHGTHVAGIVLTASNGTAELHGLAWGQFNETTEENVQGTQRVLALAKQIAPQSATYRDFVLALRNELLKDARKHGLRFSSYVKTSQAGVINMSWGKNLEGFHKLADDLHDIYADTGMDPKTIANFRCPAGMELCENLALELIATDAASMALAMYQNPDVLFVMSAGNDAKNNDKLLPSPAYLSRFFPNALTVASVDRLSRLSRFSNFGARSVQLAAEGESIISDFLGGVKGKMSGTSMAAPQVAGAAAAIRAKYPQLDAPAVRRILLASATKVPELNGMVSSSAVLNLSAALEMAGHWEKGGTVIDEPWEWPAGDDDADEVMRHEGTMDSIVMPSPLPEGTPAVTTLAGFGDKNPSWIAVMSTGGDLTDQQVKLSTEYPNDWVESNFDKDRRITSIAGDESGWAVVMSKGGYEQRVIGYEFDQTTIKKNADESFPITAIAGWSGKWIVVMDQHCGYTAQRYTLPSSFDAKRQEWIAKRWDEGYRITSLAGDQGPGDKNSWVVVMSKDTNIGDQTYSGLPGPWPDDFIKEKTDAGYAITAVSGHAPDNWVVVLSHGTDLENQRVSPSGAFPYTWIANQWSGKEAPETNATSAKSASKNHPATR